MQKIILPELGEGIEKATVACWHVNIGDEVKNDDDVVELVTDKATFNVAAETSGTLKEIFIKEGEEASIGAVLASVQ